MEVVLFLFSFLHIFWNVQAHPVLLNPKGYLLVLQALPAPTRASLFQVDFNGSVTKWWNQSFDSSAASYGAFAFDKEKRIVYLPTTNQITGVTKDGEVVVKRTLAKENYQYFWNYFYNSQSTTFSGICTNETHSEWNWCTMNAKNGVLSRLSEIPFASSNGPNGLDIYAPIYSVGLHQQLIWYKPYLYDFVVGTNFTSGDVAFISGEAGPSCITYNPLTNKTYTVGGKSSMYYELSVYELLPKPNPPKELVKLLPTDQNLIISVLGACGIIPQDNIIYVLMTNITIGTLMPTDLILVNLSDLSYEQVPLDYRKWMSDSVMTGVRYILD